MWGDRIAAMGLSHVFCRLTMYLATVVILLALAASGARGQQFEQCGACLPDPESPTDASQFCIFGPNQKGWIPCALEEPEPDTPPSVLNGADLDVTTAETPICSEGGVQSFNRIVDETLGVRGIDFGGANIGSFPAERFGILNINNWFPLDAQKHTLCGRLQRFGTYDGTGAEMDWNNFIIPNSPFMYLYTDALPYQGGEGAYCIDSDWPSCGETEECIETEVTPDQLFYENPWFPKSTEISPLENEEGTGPTMCTYGPWVRECVHGHKPEIHPSELLWWKEQEFNFFGTTELFWLMQMHDDSNRFDAEENFDFGGPFSQSPSGWRAWSAAPRRNMFYIAFALNPNFESVSFDLGQAADLETPEVFSSRFVRTQELPVPGIQPDSTSIHLHRIQYNGQVIVEAQELQKNDGDISIRFVGVCRNAQNTRLQGYLNIYTAISQSNSGEEGYHVMFVNKTTSILSLSPSHVEVKELARVPKPPSITLSTQALPETLHRTVSDGHIQLVGDLQVEIKNESAVTETQQSIAFNLIGGGFRQRLEVAPRLTEKGYHLEAVPLLGMETLEVRLESGEVLRTGVGGVAFSPLPLPETPMRREQAVEAWPAMATAGGGKIITLVAPTPPMHVPEWHLELVPEYSAVKEGKASPEDESPWIEEMNETLVDGEASPMERLFGSTQPFRVAWRFEATNLSTGEEVPVVSNGTVEEDGVHVELMSGETIGLTVPDAAVRVEFPIGVSDQVYRLVATGVVWDTLGNSSEVDFEVWSHILPVESEEDVDALLATVADLAEVSSQQLARSSSLSDSLDPEVDPTLLDPRSRRARMVRVYAINAASDGSITIGELENLVQSALLFGEDDLTSSEVR